MATWIKQRIGQKKVLKQKPALRRKPNTPIGTLAIPWLGILEQQDEEFIPTVEEEGPSTAAVNVHK